MALTQTLVAWRGGTLRCAAAAVALLSAACGPAAQSPDGWVVVRPPADVAALAVIGHDVWAGGREGLYRIDRRDGALKPLPGGPPGLRYVRDLAVDARGALWIAHGDGVARLAAGDWSTFAADDGPSQCRAMLAEPDGGVWAGCERGLYRVAAAGLERVALPGKATFQSVDVLLRDRAGRLWVGSASPVHGGLASRMNGNWRIHDEANGLPHQSVNGLCETRDGVLWLATGFAGRGGAAWFDGERWHAVSSADGLVSDDVRSIHEDAAGRLWFASEFQGSAVFARNRVAVVTPASGLAGPEVKALAVDTDGVYWIGTDRGLDRVADPSPVLDGLWKAVPSTRISGVSP